MTEPTLIACSHGTSSSRGRAAIRAIVDDVRALLPDVEVVQAYVDVESPRIDEVVASVTARDAAAVVVPLLLSAGYHTRVDISRAVAASDLAVAAPPLGTHPLIADLVVRRLVEAGATMDDAIVLAAAGSSDPASARDVREVVATVSGSWGAPVHPGFAASAEPLLPQALDAARASGRRTVAASYVLAPGYFAGVIHSAGFDLVTTPLAPHPSLAAAVVDRYRATISQWAAAR